MSNKLKMVGERLVDVWEQLLENIDGLKCEMNKTEWASCAMNQKNGGRKTAQLEPKLMCLSCQAIWYTQMARDTFLESMTKQYPDWEPVRIMQESNHEDALEVAARKRTLETG